MIDFSKRIEHILSADTNVLDLKDFFVKRLLSEVTGYQSTIGDLDSWDWVPLSDCTTFKAGRTPERGEAQYWSNGVIPWVTIADLVDSGEVLKTKERITERAKMNVFGSEPLPIGTLVMSFKLTIGKISTLGIPAFTNEAIIAIEANQELNKDYLKLVLPVIARGGKFKGALKGNTLNRDSLSKLLVPIPSLDQQAAFVEIVQEFFGLLSEVKATLNRIEKLKSILWKIYTADNSAAVELSQQED